MKSTLLMIAMVAFGAAGCSSNPPAAQTEDAAATSTATEFVDAVAVDAWPHAQTWDRIDTAADHIVEWRDVTGLQAATLWDDTIPVIAQAVIDEGDADPLVGPDVQQWQSLTHVYGPDRLGERTDLFALYLPVAAVDGTKAVHVVPMIVTDAVIEGDYTTAVGPPVTVAFAPRAAGLTTQGAQEIRDHIDRWLAQLESELA